MAKKDNSASGQRRTIHDHLRLYRGLSTQYARDILGIPHPAGRVCELRKQGVNIITNWSTEHTPDGEPHRMAKYVLLSGTYQGAM